MKKLKKNPQIITKTKPFINKYNWERIKFPSQKDDWKSYAKKEKIHPAYVSKDNSNHEKQVIFLLILNGEKLHYLAVKELSALLRAINYKHYGDFYCLSCRHSLRINGKLESHKKVCKNKDFYSVILSFEDTEILEFNQYHKSDKGPFIIYADLECITEKIDGFKNNPENSSKTKVSQQIPSGFLMSKMIYTEVKIVEKSFVNP